MLVPRRAILEQLVYDCLLLPADLHAVYPFDVGIGEDGICAAGFAFLMAAVICYIAAGIGPAIILALAAK